MPTILLSNHYDKAPYEIIKSTIPQSYTLMTLDNASREQLLEKVGCADYLLVSGRLKIDSEVLAKAPDLKMIQRTGVGTDMLDMTAIRNANIPVYVNYGVNAQSVAEHTLMLMLASLKKLPIVNSNVKCGIWEKQKTGITCHELCGKTVGLIGFGNIGQTVARLLEPFDVKLLYYDKFKAATERETELKAKYVPLKKLLSESDIVSLHCSLNEENKYLINEKSIALMKKGCILINTSRGGLVKEADLKKALKQGEIGFAALDVHENEPILPTNKLAEIDNVIMTPHIGGVTYEAFKRMMEGAVNNIVLFDKGEYEAIESKKLV